MLGSVKPNGSYVWKVLKEDNRSSQAGPPPTERLAPLRPAARLGKAALFPRLALPLSLPGKTLVFPRSVPPLPPFPPSLLLSCLHWKTGDLLIPLTPKQVKPIIQQTTLGKVAGNPQGKGSPRPPRRFILPPGKAITPPPPH